MQNYHITMSSYAGPISEYFPRFRSKSSGTFSTAGRSPKDGFINLSDTAPGFGLTLKPVDANFKLTR